MEIKILASQYRSVLITSTWNSLMDDETRNAISLWKSFVRSSFGPNGNTKIVQNSIGGSAMVTSSARCLLSHVKPSNVLLKIAAAVVTSHLKLCNDFGLFTMLLMLELLELVYITQIPGKLIADLIEYFGSIVVDHLTSSNCPCKISVDMCNITHLLSVVKSVLSSKPLCCLSESEIKYLSTVVIKAFLAKIPVDSKAERLKLGRISFICHEGLSPSHTNFYPGFLYVSTAAVQKVTERTEYKIALFDVSLAGDMHEMVADEYELDEASVPEMLAVNGMLKMCSELVDAGVGILSCQKVIHPKVFKFLQQEGILVLHRLGNEGFQALCELSGAIPIGSYFGSLDRKRLGIIDSVDVIHLHGKAYIHLGNKGSSSGTIVLCHMTESCLDELKTVAVQALDSLSKLMSKPEVYIGAGCLEMHLSHFVQNQVINADEAYLRRFGANPGQLQEVLECFIASLRRLSRSAHLREDATDILTDSELGHIWSNADRSASCYCCCKQMKWEKLQEAPIPILDKATKNVFKSLHQSTPVEAYCLKEPMIVDVAAFKLNAYKVAFETSCLLLKVGICIVDDQNICTFDTTKNIL